MAGNSNAVQSDANTVNGRKPKSRLARRLSKMSGKGLLLLLAPIYFVPSIILYFTPVRFFILPGPQRIGHLAADLDWYLKQTIIGEHPRFRLVLLLSDEECANPCLLSYWEKYILVVRSKVYRSILWPFLFFDYLQVSIHETRHAVGRHGIRPTVLRRWGDRPPLLQLSDSHRERGEEALRMLGVPPGAWFVCVHSRESGFSPEIAHLHSYRNSPISSYALAMEAIVQRGGWCIRMGDPTMEPMEPMRGVVDYAHSTQKSDWTDIFLCASCRFFLGNTSGLSMASTVFGVPVALANLIPMHVMYRFLAADVGIPKLLRKHSGEYVTFDENFNSPIANIRRPAEFEKNGLVCIDNSPEEIRDLAVEMLDRIDNKAAYTGEDEKRQADLRNLFEINRGKTGPDSRVGRDFLRKYSHLV